MATPTYHELKLKTVAELREIAKGIEHDAVHGYSQMNKEHLLPAICQALGIETIEHHAAVGIDKSTIKARMRELKAKREAALEAHDHDALRNIRRQLHRMTRDIRRHLS